MSNKNRFEKNMNIKNKSDSNFGIHRKPMRGVNNNLLNKQNTGNINSSSQSSSDLGINNSDDKFNPFKRKKKNIFGNDSASTNKGTNENKMADKIDDSSSDDLSSSIDASQEDTSKLIAFLKKIIKTFSVIIHFLGIFLLPLIIVSLIIATAAPVILGVVKLFSGEDSTNFDALPSIFDDTIDNLGKPASSTGYYSDKQYIATSDNTGYWWPIGSRETTTDGGKTFATGNPGSTLITAYFAGDDAVHYGSHGAIDISAGINVENIIATRDGVVEYPTNSDNINIGTCDYYGSKVNCNSYGNYVKINHGDGMISIYGHMYANSIKVSAGDFVKQGQVIGKSGSSGNSTGGHLHFELRLNNVRVNPLDYVSIANPRGVESNAEFDSKVIE